MFLLNWYMIRPNFTDIEPRVVRQPQVQRARDGEEPLVEKISNLTLGEMENKERVERPIVLSRASSIDSSIEEIKPYPLPVARPSVERTVTYNPPAEEPRAVAQETEAPERKQPGFRQKIFGCFSFVEKPQEPPAQAATQSERRTRCHVDVRLGLLPLLEL